MSASIEVRAVLNLSGIGLNLFRQSIRNPLEKTLKQYNSAGPIGMPIVRKLDTGLWEVRSHIKDGIARVIFTVFSDTMVLLHGFIKKSQQTPKEELETAKRRKKNLQ